MRRSPPPGSRTVARKPAAQHAGVAALLAAVLTLVFFAQMQAAMELLYYRAESTDSSVILSWATAREINVEGYLLLKKREDDPDSAYHFIGQRAAIGGPESAAEYAFAVSKDVYRGETYCFRLEEVTRDGGPGEKRDICGYGPGVTPTPTPSITPSPPPIIVTPIETATPLPPAEIPEPLSVILFGTGLAALVAASVRKQPTP